MVVVGSLLMVFVGNIMYEYVVDVVRMVLKLVLVCYWCMLYYGFLFYF